VTGARNVLGLEPLKGHRSYGGRYPSDRNPGGWKAKLRTGSRPWIELRMVATRWNRVLLQSELDNDPRPG
jgi:hypothetical protein